MFFYLHLLVLPSEVSCFFTVCVCLFFCLCRMARLVSWASPFVHSGSEASGLVMSRECELERGFWSRKLLDSIQRRLYGTGQCSLSRTARCRQHMVLLVIIRGTSMSPALPTNECFLNFWQAKVQVFSFVGLNFPFSPSISWIADRNNKLAYLQIFLFWIEALQHNSIFNEQFFSTVPLMAYFCRCLTEGQTKIY